jgi:hypothetical protein
MKTCPEPLHGRVPASSELDDGVTRCSSMHGSRPSMVEWTARTFHGEPGGGRLGLQHRAEWIHMVAGSGSTRSGRCAYLPWRAGSRSAWIAASSRVDRALPWNAEVGVGMYRALPWISEVGIDVDGRPSMESRGWGGCGGRR